MSSEVDDDTDSFQQDIVDFLESQAKYSFLHLPFPALSLTNHCRGEGPLEPYLGKARWIGPSINPFVDITEAFYAGIPEALEDDEESIARYILCILYMYLVDSPTCVGHPIKHRTTRRRCCMFTMQLLSLAQGS